VYCGRCSRAFRAVLKRQEVKGRTEFAVCSPCTLEDPAKMTSEKADVIYPSPKKTKFEQLRADHELFLQAFESRLLFSEGRSTQSSFAPFSSMKALLTCNFSIFSLSEPTQIYRFLRTRNAVAVGSNFCRFNFVLSSLGTTWLCYLSSKMV